MKTGHAITLFSAGLVVVGALGMPWQAFQIADITAPGWAVPGGQVLSALGMLIALAAAFGVTGRRQRQAATLNVFVGACAVAWLVAAHVTRTLWFELTPEEVVTMAGGFTLACWAVGGVLIGSLMVLAQDPAAAPGQPVLRVAMLWGDTVIDERELLRPGQITLGEDATDDITAEVSAALGIHFPLFRATPDGYAMGLDPSLQGTVTLGRDGEHVDLREFMEASPEVSAPLFQSDTHQFRELQDGDWGIVDLQAGLRVFFELRPAPVRTVRRFGWFAFDESVTAAIAASGVAQLMFVVWAVVSWQEQPVRLVQQNPAKTLRVEASLHQRHVQAPAEQQAKTQPLESSQATEGESGALGDPDEPVERKTRLRRRRIAEPDPPPSNRSMLDLLKEQSTPGKGPIASIFGKPDEAYRNKFRLATAGGLSDDLIGYGSPSAVGFKGNGRGGDGHGPGVLHGTGWDDGAGTAERPTAVSLKPKTKRRVPKVSPRPVSPTGHCSKADIRKKVRRRVGMIRACYERRLTARPNLSGKVTLRWTIGEDGRVSGVGHSGSLKDGQVTRCIKRAVRLIRFKKPESGICVVKWPFAFQSGV